MDDADRHVGALRLSRLVKSYPSGGEIVRAVHDVSLDVSVGELVALFGPSGSGKTTLLQLAAGLIHPDRGRVIFDGREVSSLSSTELARYRREDVGLVFQNFHLITGASAVENVAVKLLADGLTLKNAKRRALPWLDRLGLAARLEHTPAEMSMGERQRVAIARALVGEPRLLLADEPTGNLDSKRSQNVLALLREICVEREIPVLLVTHDAQAAAYATRVHTLRDGRLSNGLEVELEPELSR